MTLAREVACPECGKRQTLTIIGKFRNHGPRNDPCGLSGTFAPSELLPPLPPKEPRCPSSPVTSPESTDVTDPAKSVISTKDSGSTTMPETSTSPSTITPTPRNPDGGKKDALAPSEDASAEPLPLPGVDEYAKDLARRQLAAYSEYEQPDKVAPVEYEQPDRLNRAVTHAVPMNEEELHVASMLKEIFYQYTNRSRRAQQSTLGPSQIGSPCDRRIVMHLLGMPRVNPGGDRWAATKGTWVHSGLEAMLKWADANQGRFATETRVKFPSEVVPAGTLDVIDRVLYMVIDHKVMGQWSLDKLKRSGIMPLYRVQLHVYAYGARIRGEKVERVALVGWPVDKPNLDDLYVKIEQYDPQIARDAFARVEALKRQIDGVKVQGWEPLRIANAASIADDCRFCPYHMSDAKDLTNGACNGRS